MPQFSIVIPTYNRGPMLLEALESVLAQSVSDREVIVVDDGSTDRTGELLAPYRDRVRYVRIANAGPAAAKNRGVQLAEGELIGFLDSDDLWDPDTLASVSEAFERDPEIGFVSIMAREITSDGRRSERVYGKKSAGPFYSTGSLLSNDSGGCSWFFLRREILEQLGGFDESLRSAEECDLFLRCSLATRMVAVRQPLLLRRAHDGNLSNDVALNARCWIRLLEKFRREHPEAARRNRWNFRRALAKERLRLGRELLVHRADEANGRAESRRELRRSVMTYPFFLRGYTYLGWSWLAPTTFARWRGQELKWKKAARGGA